MELAKKYQKQLLEQARFLNQRNPLSEGTEKAFLAVPRHLFVKRYREGGSKIWHEVTEENIQEHIPALYADHPLTLFGEEDQDRTLSTISQPSFVLRMLDMLQLQPGQKVFELGAGSGWNAALMGHLVGAAGHVYSVELLPELVVQAQQSLKAVGLNNVTISNGDGGDGYTLGVPYDRAVFTAGTYDVPHAFYEQVRNQGMLLIGLKNPGGGDNLFLLRKVNNHFESIQATPCGWIQLRGKYKIDELAPIAVESLPGWNELLDRVVAKVPFWWGGTTATDPFAWRTLAIRSFLAITEPLFLAFKAEKSESNPREDQYFGLWDPPRRSLVLAKDDSLVGYGDRSALDQLMHRVRQWVDLGMPIGACFQLRVYPIEEKVEPAEDQWLVKRRESQFLWGL